MNSGRYLLVPTLILVSIAAACTRASQQQCCSYAARPPVSMERVTVGNQVADVLYVNGKNFGLRPVYYNTRDTGSSAACIKRCLATWPPVNPSGLVAGNVNGNGLPGVVSVIKGTTGPQLAYRAHPLYMYTGDSNGQAPHGNGMNGQWFVVTTGLR